MASSAARCRCANRAIPRGSMPAARRNRLRPPHSTAAASDACPAGAIRSDMRRRRTSEVRYGRSQPWLSAEEVQMGVLVILEMDGPTDALLAAAADLEARRPTSAVLARIAAPTKSGVVVTTFWESAEARDDYQSQPEHSEALRASGLLDAVSEMR